MLQHHSGLVSEDWRASEPSRACHVQYRAFFTHLLPALESQWGHSVQDYGRFHCPVPGTNPNGQCVICPGKMQGGAGRGSSRT